MSRAPRVRIQPDIRAAVVSGLMQQLLLRLKATALARWPLLRRVLEAARVALDEAQRRRESRPGPFDHQSLPAIPCAGGTQ
jgi:hypothetical protein